ncbi:MAG: metallophosphoesterase [Pseudomonadota bacterium]|nr:metallophosphoesterase [Pseudomonadota bacterium]
MALSRLFLLLIILGLALTAWAYRLATRAPVLREAEVRLDGLGGQAVRVVLISDVHVAGPDMPPRRLAGIVAGINRLRPDLVVIAGDLVSDRLAATRHYSMDQAVAPLAGLRAKFGTFAVLGNHDHWRDAGEARAALARAGIRLLDNDAARAGPLVVGGLDDAYTGRDDLARTVGRMRSLGGVPVLLSHSPDPFARAPADVQLMLAGHTHCGQIRLPLIGALSYMSEYGSRFGCGRINEGGRTLIVAAGLGTSMLPLRIGAAPDYWLVTLRGEAGGS